ncbi:conserved hypothetical protein [Gloeothece citriformis PCC 7424]|uniref:Pentapeptide repeat protein n=1 Tax=Gloeothece citriformis (strain PCC 7424) TaxID=65393 RepID=B7KEX0_GLOC7|nr:pentapeptide repeat-containing protein [Gloeothece citriformis]ACK70426.1 conserved hypothetical protein [Gloeothece citriformis PCC 7424]
MRTWIKLLIGLWVIGWVLFSCSPVFAASSRVPLTPELLQERLTNLILSDGVSTIDLTYLTIDLSNENSEFRQTFYQQLQNRLNRSKQPLGIDFSDSIIIGELNASGMGLPTPLSTVALSPLLTPLEQEQLKKDARFRVQDQPHAISVTVFRGFLKFQRTLFNDRVDFSNTFFLQSLEALDANFKEETNFSGATFARIADFSQAIFEQNINFSEVQFFAEARFSHTQFKKEVKFMGSRFEKDGIFDEAEFSQLADFSQIQWLGKASLSQTHWRDRVLFSKSIFFESLSLVNATFEKSVAFRATLFKQRVELKDVKLLSQIDFSNGIFFPHVFINVSGLAFESESAKILGDTGIIGKILVLSKLEENETVVRNLVQNFRNLEQIPDANQIEYKKEKLRFSQLSTQIYNSSLTEILQGRWLKEISSWLLLSLLLLFSHFGSNFNLVLGVGIVSISYFGFLFWFVDRWRRRFPNPILPERYDIYCMSLSFIGLTIIGISDIFQSAEYPGITLIGLSFLLLPIPLGLVGYLYYQGRYHDLMDTSYFMREGSLRDLRLLIVRLPIIPENVFFRDRYTFLPWQRRWNWLNYYDFSLNNWLKIGFNDIRLRDQHLPGIISTLVWYQWSLGLLYIALLLWTLSRTIPGLNLLIYLK